MQNSKRVAIFVFGLMTLGIYLPILKGSIPIPRDMVLQFPPWLDFVRSHSWQQSANIGDLVTVFYPFRRIAGRAVQQGVLPLWNPYLLGGAPFLARAESALFYPLTLIYYVLPLWMAWAAASFLRTYLAAFFTWLFMKSIGVSDAGAILGGIVYACCGWMTAWQGYSMSDSAIWLPLILYRRRDSYP